MITLSIGHSFSNIKGLTVDQEKDLRKLLSYTENAKSAYFGKGYARTKSLLGKRGDFPTGLLSKVINYLGDPIDKNYRILDSTNTPAFKPFSLPSNYPKPYPAQLTATDRAVNAERGTIAMPTGTGKSLVIALIASRIGLKTLVIVPSLEIKKQLSEGLKALKNVFIENIDSTSLKSMTDFDCLIIDEAHHAAAKTYQKLNKTAWTKIAYRFFLTATPWRNDQEEQLLLESIAGEIIYKLDYQEAIKEGYIVPIEAYYIELPKRKTDAFTWREVYNECVVNDALKNQEIVNILTQLQTSGKSTLCLVKEVKHGQILSEITGLPFVSGADDDSRKYIGQFNNSEIKVLIGTTGVLGEGVDTKPCEYVLIAGLGKAKSQFMQAVGRAVRRYPEKESAKIILIQDKTHKFLSRHFKAQCVILKAEYGVTPIKL